MHYDITLIGMPGVGKSTIGKRLADELGYSFIDLDTEIMRREGKSLHEIISSSGDGGLISLEEREALLLNFDGRTVISPGGSIIYSPNAMAVLENHTHIIYLKASFEDIRKRIPDPAQRGIIGLEKGLDRLYEERDVLYNQYADSVIGAGSADIEGIVRSIIVGFPDHHFEPG